MKTDNELIAEFMGHRVEYYTTIPPQPTGAVLIDGLVCEMQYDTSWDWLMPVVEKCRGTLRGKWNDMSRLQFNFIAQSLMDLNLKETYRQVVEFIKWYSDQKK